MCFIYVYIHGNIMFRQFDELGLIFVHRFVMQLCFPTGRYITHKLWLTRVGLVITHHYVVIRLPHHIRIGIIFAPRQNQIYTSPIIHMACTVHKMFLYLHYLCRNESGRIVILDCLSNVASISVKVKIHLEYWCALQLGATLMS